MLYGGDGIDQIVGGLGEDIIVGGTGDDFLVGGTLAAGPDGEQDIFVFAPGDGLDSIIDWEDTGVFNDGLDLLDLSAFGLASTAFIQETQNGTSVEITIVGVDPADFMITLANTTTADFDVDDVILS